MVLPTPPLSGTRRGHRGPSQQWSWRGRWENVHATNLPAMTSHDGAVTLHMFIRPGTPASAGMPLLSQIAEMYEFGVLGPGSRVWCNLDIPNALWVLSDISTFLRIVDVPTAGWVRLSSNAASWGSVASNIARTPGYSFSTAHMPIEVQPHDTVTVAFRNTDTARMRAMFSQVTHHMDDFEITHKSLRVIDFKTGGFERKQPLGKPSEFDIHYAAVRGLDLLAATTGPAMHKVLRENLESFTAQIDVAEFDRIRSVQQRMAQIAEGVTDPIVQRIAKLEAVGPFQVYTDEDASGDSAVGVA